MIFTKEVMVCSKCMKEIDIYEEALDHQCSPQNLPKADAYSLLAEVRARIDAKFKEEEHDPSDIILMPGDIGYRRAYHEVLAIIDEYISKHFS